MINEELAEQLEIIEDAVSKMYFYFFLVVDIARENSEHKREDVENIIQKFKKAARRIHTELNYFLPNKKHICINSLVILVNNDNQQIKEYTDSFKAFSNVDNESVYTKNKAVKNLMMDYSFQGDVSITYCY